MKYLAYLLRRVRTEWQGGLVCNYRLCGRSTQSWVYRRCEEHRGASPY